MLRLNDVATWKRKISLFLTQLSPECAERWCHLHVVTCNVRAVISPWGVCTLRCPHRQALGMIQLLSPSPFERQEISLLSARHSTDSCGRSFHSVAGSRWPGRCKERTQQTATSRCSCVTCCWRGLSALHKADCRDGCSNLTCGLNQIRPSFPTLLSHHTAAIPTCQLLPTLAVSSASVLLYLIIPWLGLSCHLAFTLNTVPQRGCLCLLSTDQETASHLLSQQPIEICVDLYDIRLVCCPFLSSH